ncbi:MAG: uncharacterized protein JWL84_5426 [Rhodospirillales bacterium]|nr:uncharacterized protein [Rhodospirillales bacterium]
MEALNVESLPQRVVDEDGAVHEIFALPTDAASLEALLRELFAEHWHEITFGPIIQGAAWEMRAAAPPEKIKMFDGYLTVTFGVPHFHICIGEHKGPHNNRVSPELAHHRRTGRAELYRRLSRAGTPVSWGLRLFNGKGEQQITILLPNPFLHPETDKILKVPDWSRLALWDHLRSRWLGLAAPDPFDRSGTGFRHD